VVRIYRQCARDQAETGSAAPAARPRCRTTREALEPIRPPAGPSYARL